MEDVGLNTVRWFLEHKDPKMTLRYAHSSPEHLHSAAAKLNDLRNMQVDTEGSARKRPKLTFSQLIAKTEV